MDQAPGPIIASVTPDVARRMGVPSQEHEKAIHISITAIDTPQMGVHKPRSRRIAVPVAIKCGTINANRGASLRCANPKQNRNVAVTMR